MKNLFALFITSVLISLHANVVAANKEFIALCYHDVQDRIEQTISNDVMAVSTAELISHFSWLKENGYHVVSLDDVLQAKAGGKSLPDKAVLLTFDDGYESFYSRIYPLLKLFNYPAVYALVGKWMDQPPGSQVAYGRAQVPREAFLNWTQVKEMADSGLVEIASHSYDLHRGILANPQQNTQPAAITRIYDGAKYESDQQYTKRIREDLRKSIAVIENNTGYRPRAIVWPYGSYSSLSDAIAKEEGLEIGLSLDSDVNHLDSLLTIKRILVGHKAKLKDVVWKVHHPKLEENIRVAHVDLDYVFDPDPSQQEKNLGFLLDRIKELEINTVYLQAYADPQGNGLVREVYFPNRHLPMRADLFNRVAWQLRTRANVSVYAWMPVMAFDFGDAHPVMAHRVQSAHAEDVDQQAGYQRLSIFHTDVRKIILDVYEDLAKSSNFLGLLFHDDALLGDFEDNSPAALSVYQEKWGLPGSIEAIRAEPDLFKKWSQYKTEYLIDWTKELTARVKKYRPSIKTARNIYAEVVLNDDASTWFAQSLPAFLSAYNYTSVMAMPYMENASHPEKWLQGLVNKVKPFPDAMHKTVFELQSVDWRNQGKVDSVTLARQMSLLRNMGVLNYGYYPDDFIQQHPELETIRPAMSLSRYPYR